MLLSVPVDQNTTLQRSESLLNTTARWADGLAEDQLSAEVPALGHVPGLRGGLADRGIEVLQIAPETFGAESGPRQYIGSWRWNVRTLSTD